MNRSFNVLWSPLHSLNTHLQNILKVGLVTWTKPNKYTPPLRAPSQTLPPPPHFNGRALPWQQQQSAIYSVMSLFQSWSKTIKVHPWKAAEMLTIPLPECKKTYFSIFSLLVFFLAVCRSSLFCGVQHGNMCQISCSCHSRRPFSLISSLSPCRAH